MGGVVIGSTMELVKKGQRWGALMINTGCNLSCPMCYLGEKGQNRTMEAVTAEKIAALSQQKHWDGIALIGTEPLLNEESVRIINIFASSGKTTHIITNGVNLEIFANKISEVKRVDISLDGGPKTYPRGGFFAVIQRGVSKWKDLSEGDVCIVNALSRENISNIEDMLEGSRLLGVAKTFFSPYVRTLGGHSGATPLSTAEIVQALLPFGGSKWKLMMDPYHAIFEWREWKLIKDEVNILPEENKLIIDFDPGEGVRRMDVDGSEQHPFIALHPGIKLLERKV